MLGLARSGEAAALALARRGVRVVGVDRRPDATWAGFARPASKSSSARTPTSRWWNACRCWSRAPGYRARRRSSRPRASAACPCGARSSSARAWSHSPPSPSRGRTGRRRRPSCSVRSSGPRRAGRRLRQRRPPALRARREALIRRGRRLRALELPARGRRRRSVATSPSFSTSRRTTSTVTARWMPTARRSCASSSARRPGTPRSCRAASAPSRDRAGRIEFRADDDLPAEPLIPGAHNRENAAAAAAAARAAGIADDAIAEALRTFPGVAHRLEPVRELAGVRFVNDSKATNPESAERALEAYPPGTLRVILGGSRKQGAFDSLARVASRRAVLAAYLIGETAGELADALETQAVAFERCGELENAVARAAADARPGEVVLLSPACASFDQFRDFEQRGERFRALVEALVRRSLSARALARAWGERRKAVAEPGSAGREPAPARSARELDRGGAGQGRLQVWRSARDAGRARAARRSSRSVSSRSASSWCTAPALRAPRSPRATPPTT